MNYLNQYHDSISTVQLSPFGEEQWSRIVTYSPIYVHWTDMLMITQPRTNKTTAGKLNLINEIDLNTLKLEDEILLNELYQIRRTANAPSKEKTINYESKIFDNKQDHQIDSSKEDFQASSDYFNESEEPIKHQCSYAEPLFTNKHPFVIDQTIPLPIHSISQIQKLPKLSLGPKPQPSLGVQLRQSTMAREHALSATHDRRSSTTLSISSSKRTINSAHSNPRYYQRQQLQNPTSQSPLLNEINPTNNIHEQSIKELSSNSIKKPRAKSSNSSRSTMHMLKTKNDRTRQKQNIELKTLLVDPWKQALYSNGIFEETIPNSLEIMHKLCGPATPFERNLRSNFHRQLNQFRNGSMNS